MTARRIHPLAAFAALALAVNFAVAALAPLAATHPRGSLIAAGGLADLTIAIPALYYWLVVRTGTQPLITIAPVALLGYLKASWTFPGVAPGGAVVAGLCEIGVMAFIAHRVRRGVRLARGADGDVLARIGAAVFDLIPMRAAAKAAASEIAVFYYAFFSWRAKPEAAGFTIHRETGFVTLLGVVAVASIGEAAGMHLVLRRWSHVAAWVLTALSVYGAIWIVALARSIVLRPVLVTADALILRVGLLWSVTVPRANVLRIGPMSAPPERGYLRIGPLADPSFLIELREPVVAEGPYGLRRTVSAIGLYVDDPAAFKASL